MTVLFNMHCRHCRVSQRALSTLSNPHSPPAPGESPGSAWLLPQLWSSTAI
uniref:Uncharacterized protein n=1 Tax=Anguilla anguilla TaxID=7936 RepID=A0A0E9QYN5_ANGAN